MGWKTTLFRCGPPPPSETGTLPPHQLAFFFKESLDPISHESKRNGPVPTGFFQNSSTFFLMA